MLIAYRADEPPSGGTATADPPSDDAQAGAAGGTKPQEGNPDAQAGAGSDGGNAVRETPNAEAARYRRQLREVEQERDQLRTQVESDQQRIERERNELQEENRRLAERNRDLMGESVARELGFRNPAAGVRLTDWTDVDITDRKAVEKALRKVIEDVPELVDEQRRDIDAGAGRRQPSKGGMSMNDLLRSKTGRG